QADDGERGQAVREVHLDGDLRGVESRESTAVKHRERHGAYFCLILASSSTTRRSSSASFSRVRASALACTSNSSRVARSSFANAAVSRALRFFSRSLAGLVARNSLILALSSSSIEVGAIVESSLAR